VFSLSVRGLPRELIVTSLAFIRGRLLLLLVFGITRYYLLTIPK
jgi:hypothetical protein